MQLTEFSLNRAKLFFWLWRWSRLWLRFWFFYRCRFDDRSRCWNRFFVDRFSLEDRSWLWLIGRNRLFNRLSLIGFILLRVEVWRFENRDLFFFRLFHWLLINRSWLWHDLFFEGWGDFLFFNWRLNYVRSNKRSGFCRLFFRFWHNCGWFDALGFWGSVIEREHSGPKSASHHVVRRE